MMNIQPVLYLNDNVWPYRLVVVVIETLDIKRNVYIKTNVYDISRDFSSLLALEMYG